MKTAGEILKSYFFPICFCAYMCVYIARVNLSIAAPELQRAMILSTEQLGLMGGAFSVTYAVGRMLSGAVGDRTVPWKLICTGLLLVSTANLCVGLFPPFVCLFLLWSINALAQSMLWSPMLRIISCKYPYELSKKRASTLGLAVAGGNITGLLVSGFVISHFSVSSVFLYRLRFPRCSVF